VTRVVDARPVLRTPSGCVAGVTDSVSPFKRNIFYDKELAMIEQEFSPQMYSPATEDLIPDDAVEDGADAWQDYCFEAAHVDRQRVLDCVLSSLDCDDSLLYALIDSAIKTPHEPGRARESITVLAQVGQAILDRVAAAVDDNVNLRMAIGGAR
jgi:hypothetical protein